MKTNWLIKKIFSGMLFGLGAILIFGVYFFVQAIAPGATDNPSFPPPPAGGSDNVDFDFGTASLATNGYQRLPSGLLMQWGRRIGYMSESAFTVTFPIPFTEVFNTECTLINQGIPGGFDSINDLWCQVVDVTTTTGTFAANWTGSGGNDIGGAMWFAIGR